MTTETESAAITDSGTLRDHYGEPLAIAVACAKSSLDRHHKNFIAHSPFMCLASADADGQPNVSPKGDKPGFVHIVDDNTLVIPDRPGNNKVETMHNLVENPRVAMIFFIPGISESLRVHGTARLVCDDEMLAYGKIGGKLPKSAVVVTVTKAYMHCGKALLRSKIWDQESHIADGVIEPFSKVVKEQTQAPMSVEALQDKLDHDYQALY